MRTVLITGANKGIGLETAKQLSDKGFLVYMGSRDIEKGTAIAKEHKGEGYKNITAIAIDVTNEDSIALAFSIIEKEQGQLDILINNAGISGIVPQNAMETPVENYREVFNVNLYGTIRVTQAFIGLLKKSVAPRIVNVSTSVGSLSLQSNPAWPAYNYGKYAVYAASKAAMNMYTVHLAYELRDTAFKINAVCPGYTKTNFTNYNGGDVNVAAERIIKYVVVDQNGPSGKFFSEETNPDTGEISW
jgi:NAD(P)-dependent dehydrogenase (short-subunit alcohol dehydrogenase family)